MLKEIKTIRSHYFEDELDRKQGELKKWYESGNRWMHIIFVNGTRHGEYKLWSDSGQLLIHCFYVDGVIVSFDEIPYPTTPEDRMFFKLKYDLPLHREAVLDLK